MNKEILNEIANISATFEARLQRYVGEQNDELSRAQITEELRVYIANIRALVPISVDLGKIGLSKLCPYHHGDVVPNDYTIATFKVVADMLAAD